jgi:hypothetical protein
LCEQKNKLREWVAQQQATIAQLQAQVSVIPGLNAQITDLNAWKVKAEKYIGDKNALCSRQEIEIARLNQLNQA